MRKITKFLVAGFLLLTGFLGITNTRNEVKEVEAASNKVTLKLSSSTWGSASARYTIHYWGGTTSSSWPGAKFNNGAAVSGSKEITATWDDTSTNFIIIRWNGSTTTYESKDEWNRWNYFDTHTCTPGQYNYFTNTNWDSCSSSKVNPTVEYTVTYYNGTKSLGSEKVVDGTEYNAKFYEQEGYKFEGWYTDSSLTTAYVQGTALKKNLSLYGKYTAAEDYTVYFKDGASTLGSTVYAYMWRSAFGGENATWPGAKLQKDAYGRFVINIDASKSFDMVVFNNGGTTDAAKKQTVDIKLADCEAEGTFVLGTTKDTQGHYNVTVEAAPATPELSIAVTPVEKSGLKFYAGFPAEDAHHIKNNNVGFKFVFSGTGVETKTGYYVCSTTTQTITNIVDGEPVTLNAADNGYAFYFGVIIENIPEGYNNVEITPAYQHTNGTTIYLTAKTLDFTVENAVVNF